MSVADKLLQVNQVKQDIKTAIETKGVPMTNVAFTEYANKILDISGGGGGNGGGWDISYEEYALVLFYRGGHQSLFSNAWTNHNKRTTLFDGNISFVVTDDDSLGFPVSFYSGAGIDELYDLLASGGARQDEALKITVNNTVYDATSSNAEFAGYAGDQSQGNYFKLPTPAYVVMQKIEVVEDGVTYYVPIPFLAVIDTTELGMPLGKAIAFLGIENVNYLKIESGFNHYYKNGIIIPDGVEIVPENSYSGDTRNEIIDEYFKNNDFPLVIPNSVTSIGDAAFINWQSNNQPLVISNSMTIIGYRTFYGWSSNNQPLVIPNSVRTIGHTSFSGWNANNQPLTIPDSVTSIESQAFYQWEANNHPLVIPNSVTEIGYGAFEHWRANSHPLVIPNSVTSIDRRAFYDWFLVPYVEMRSITPPTLRDEDAFGYQNNAPIYVPDESVEAYKTATNWVELADRIFPISDR